MSTIINCAECQRKLEVPDSLLGQLVKCPACGLQFIARSPNQPTSAPPPLPPSPQKEALSAGGYSNPKPARSGGDYLENRRDEYDDDDEEIDRRQRRRRKRRDLMPHHGPTILVMGIIGIVVAAIGLLICWIPYCSIFFVIVSTALGVTAILMGRMDLKAMDQGIMDPEGRGAAKGGLICGIVATVVNLIGLLGCALIMFGLFTLAALSPDKGRRRLELDDRRQPLLQCVSAVEYPELKGESGMTNDRLTNDKDARTSS